MKNSPRGTTEGLNYLSSLFFSCFSTSSNFFGTGTPIRPNYQFKPALNWQFSIKFSDRSDVIKVMNRVLLSFYVVPFEFYGFFRVMLQ